MSVVTQAGKQAIKIKVNGAERELLVDPRRTLMEVLRDDLDLTGTKEACDGGECGSCTVLLGGRGVMSCLLAVGRVGAKEVVTIEGLSSYARPCDAHPGEEPLHPLQRAFADGGAAQCGFCIPGMIMESHALLTTNPDPTRADIESRLARNTCRCTGYSKIVDAVMVAAKAIREDTALPELEYQGKRIGARAPKWDSQFHVTGRSKYAADLKKEGMLYARILHSPHHHANILGIDTTAAEALPGVKSVITHESIPGRKTLMNCKPQMHMLAIDRVRFVGEAIAAVAAESEEIADQAVRLIKVQYDVLDPVLNPLDAMHDIGPQIHPPFPNWVAIKPIEKGDPDQAFAQAAAVVESTYHTTPREHAPMEPEAALAYEAEDGMFTFHSPHHHPFAGRMWLAEMLGIDKSRVRVICPAMGGNFGHRGEFVHTGVAGLLAAKTGRPVKIVYTREESMLGSSKSHSYDLKYRTGVDKTGKIVAFEAEVIGDGGCWIWHPEGDLKGSPLGYMIGLIAGPYSIPNARVRMFEVCTNRPRSGPLRGTDVPDLAFAWESQMDQLAEALAIDPLELRILNAIEKDQTTITGVTLDESVSARAVMEALQAPYQAALARAKTDPQPAPWRRGVGIGCCWKTCGAARGDNAGGAWTGMDIGLTMAAVELSEAGRVRALAGAVEKGQGISIALAQIAAEELDVPLEMFDATLVGDTFLAPYPMATSGQRTTFLAGSAVLKAARSLKQSLIAAAAAAFDVLEAAVDFKEGIAGVAGDPNHRLTLRELAGELLRQGLPLKYEATHVFEKSEDGQGPVYTYTAQLVELDVNMETGAVKVQDVTYVGDPGNVINPLIFEGQVEGGVVMGLGFALTEEFVAGEITGLKQYGLPLIKDAPKKVTTMFVENPVNGGPFGAKGAAESTAAAGMAAVANAIANATGKRLFELPAKPARILQALRS
ncbi:MAG: molybdopterin-dependent oxidoreductase [Candidatus Dormibacteraeota bacterium]|nr:molybdopterin-dependent oxidoreductase [Candidatus Dormibacteraeota bacterium]